MRSRFGPFSQLGAKELAVIEAGKLFNRYPAGQVLFQEGDPVLGLYCLRRGWVKLFRIGPAGKAHILRLSGPGDLLGCRDLVSGSTHRCYAEAVAEVDICRIPARCVAGLLEGAPSLLSCLVGSLAADLTAVEERLVDRSQLAAEARLRRFLAECARRFGARGPLEIPLSRREIADCIGAAYETVIRRLRLLDRQGVLRVRGRRIEVLDPGRLAAAD